MDKQNLFNQKKLKHRVVEISKIAVAVFVKVET